MPRTTKQNGIIEGKILARLDSIDQRLEGFEKKFEVIEENRLAIARLKIQWKVATILLPIFMGVIGFLIGKI